MNDSAKRRARRRQAPGQMPAPGQTQAPGQMPVAPSLTPPTPSPAPGLSSKPGGHALYRAVMRSHDRVATRHLNPGR